MKLYHITSIISAVFFAASAVNAWYSYYGIAIYNLVVCVLLVIVSLKSTSTDNTPRCRDCAHCILAKKQYNQYYASPVCKMQPKENKGYRTPAIKKQQRYYAVRPSDAACEYFKSKKQK